MWCGLMPIICDPMGTAGYGVKVYTQGAECNNNNVKIVASEEYSLVEKFENGNKNKSVFFQITSKINFSYNFRKLRPLQIFLNDTG